MNVDVNLKQDIEMPYDTSTAGLYRASKLETLAPSDFCEGAKESSPRPQRSHVHRRGGAEQRETKKSSITKHKKTEIRNNTRTRGSNIKQILYLTSGSTDVADQCTDALENPEDEQVKLLTDSKCAESDLGIFKQPVPPALNTKPLEQKTYTCDICQLIFIGHGHLKAHRLTHTEEPAVSDGSGFIYTGNDSLASEHATDKLHKCTVCDLDAAMCSHILQVGGKPFLYDASNNTGDGGEAARSKVKRKPYKCNVCGIAFVANCYLIRHNRIHTGEKPYKCDVCGRDFRESAQMKRHKRTHTGEKPFKCDICGAGFIASYYLTRHRRKHTGEKPYKCDICALDFNSNDCLKRHRRIHTGEKPYKCDFCGLFFRERGQMKTHKRIHTGEKPFRCEICGLGFTQSGHLIRHKRTHTGDKPYKCDMCDQVFIQSDCLKRHKRVHAGEKPYSCDMCGLDFTERVSLKRHKKTHIAEKSLKFDV